jgi:hypothetical protein
MHFTLGAVFTGRLVSENNLGAIKWLKIVYREYSLGAIRDWAMRFPHSGPNDPDPIKLHLLDSQPSYLTQITSSVQNGRAVRKEASFMGGAEGIDKEGGVVGLLMNPDIDNKDPGGAAVIRNFWIKNFQEDNDTFDHTRYPDCIIDANGFIHLPWTDEMKEYDLIVMTLLIPKND